LNNGRIITKNRDKKFDKRRGLDEAEQELNATMDALISPDKIAQMKFTVFFHKV